MNQQRDLLKWLWPFFLMFFVINFTGVFAIAFYGKEVLHLFFNQNFHNKIADGFFRFYTDLATTYVLIALFLYIIFNISWLHMGYLVLTGGFASFVGRMIISNF